MLSRDNAVCTVCNIRPLAFFLLLTHSQTVYFNFTFPWMVTGWRVWRRARGGMSTGCYTGPMNHRTLQQKLTMCSTPVTEQKKEKKRAPRYKPKGKKKIFPWMNSSYLVPTSGRVRVERGILTELELSHQAQIVVYLAFSIKSIRYSYTFMNVLHILTAYLRPCKLGH